MTLLKLGDACTKIGSGATPRGGSEVYLPTGVSLIRSQNVHNDGFFREGLAFIGEKHANELSGVEVQAGDVLLNITGDSVARCCRAPESVLPARVNQHVAIIRPDPERLDPRYLHFYLVSPEKQNQMLSLAGGGATRNALTKGMIERFEVPAPAIDVQRAIAAVLGSLDDKIEQNRRTGRKLEELARAVFKAWFVDFEPVKAKAAGATAFPGMPPETFATLPTRLKDSPLGPVPEGWEVGKVGDLGDVICGKTPPTNDPSNYGDDVDFITIPDMHGKVFVSNTGRKLSFKGADTQPKKFVPGRSIAVSCIATPGLVVMTAGRAQTNQQINTVVPHKRFDPHFCYELLLRLGNQIRAGGSGGSVFHNLNKSSFEAIEVALPPGELISAYGRDAKPLFDVRLAMETESRKLATLRDYLLPRLLSGRVRVRDVPTVGEV